jgi:adhesin transport system outer membrane protein
MKKSKKSSAIAGAILVMTGGVALAQNLPAPLVTAAQKAVVTNPEVQARWREYTGAVADGDAAKAGYKPQVDLALGVGREWKDYPGVTPSGSQTEYTRTGGSVTLTQMLFDGMFTRNEVKRLGYAKLVRYYELLEASENISLEAVKAYADVARRSELVEEARANFLEHKLTSVQIDQKARAGVARRVDLDQANGRLALAESNLLTEISNLHDVSARYLRIMGEKPPVKMPTLPEGLRLNGIPSSANEAMRVGLPNSPTINAAYENVRSSQSNIETRKASYWPRVDFRIRDSWGRNVDGVDGSRRDQVAEVVLNYNLYRGGYDKARENQAVEYRFQARDLQEKACRDVRQTLAIAYQDVVKLDEQMGYLQTHQLSTEKAMQAYRQQFDIGQRTLLDLLDTQNELFEANRAYINARYDEIIAQARTLASMGKLTAALGVGRPDQPSLQAVGQDRQPLLPPEELCPFDVPELAVVDKSINEPPPLPVKLEQPLKVTFPASALFDFDKAVLKSEGKKGLDNLMTKIKGVDVEIYIVVGHTDSIGAEDYNQKLSERRADSVKAYFVSQGVPHIKVRTEGRGETMPVASNKTAVGRSQNRRVEVTVVPTGYQGPIPALALPKATGRK